MPSTDIYARCNFTRSGHPNIRFNVIIKVPKAKLEEMRQLPANRDQTDNQLLGSLAGNVITIVYPDPGATFALGCERYLRHLEDRRKESKRLLTQIPPELNTLLPGWLCFL
jgi:hypothetical protein